VPHLLLDTLPPPAIPQHDRDRLLGIVLSDDVLVELGDDLTRSEFVEPDEVLGL
jgi:hypothetical protein